MVPLELVTSPVSSPHDSSLFHPPYWTRPNSRILVMRCTRVPRWNATRGQAAPRTGCAQSAHPRNRVGFLTCQRASDDRHRACPRSPRCSWATGLGTRDAFAKLTRGLEAPISFRRKAVRRMSSYVNRGCAHFHGFGCRRPGGMKAEANYLATNYLAQPIGLSKEFSSATGSSGSIL